MFFVRLLITERTVNKLLNLYGLLNKCNTSMGSRRLMSWIKQPLLSLEEISLNSPIISII